MRNLCISQSNSQAEIFAPCIFLLQPANGISLFMDAKSARKAHLRLLEQSLGSVAAVADVVGTDANYISSIIGPKAKRNLGDPMARRYEKALGLPHGAFDQAPKSAVPTAAREAERPYRRDAPDLIDAAEVAALTQKIRGKLEITPTQHELKIIADMRIILDDVRIEILHKLAEAVDVANKYREHFGSTHADIGRVNSRISPAPQHEQSKTPSSTTQKKGAPVQQPRGQERK